ASNSQGRTQEGTGIGLSLVKELVGIHNGQIFVRSEPEKGSTFTVTVPIIRNLHTTSGTKYSENIKSQFIEEALQWSDGLNNEPNCEDTQIVKDRVSKPRIILADDNSDMRAYIVRLLQKDFNVAAVTNGEDAFKLALQWQPDLILTDVMMPQLDGFALLQKLKS